jgi:SAM-dependent methyltransferase
MSTTGQIQYTYWQLGDGRQRKLLPDKKFDRKTFDPLADATDRAILNVLRTPGRARYTWMEYNRGFYPSTSMRCLLPSMRGGENAGEAYIDFGCGESGDRFIAHRLGYRSLGVDLFPPVGMNQPTDVPRLVIEDIAEPLPFPDYEFTYATCHAVIALLPVADRANFYAEAYRCMKVGGTFVLSGLELKNGHGFDLDTGGRRDQR